MKIFITTCINYSNTVRSRTGVHNGHPIHQQEIVSSVRNNMQVKFMSQEYSEILHWNDIFTSVYLVLFVSYLYYNNLLLLMGKFANIYSILLLAILEILKYMLFIHRHGKAIHKHVKDFLKCLLAAGLFFVIIYTVTVLFGASMFSDFQETFMFTLLITTLTAFPVCMFFGAETAITMFLSITSHRGSDLQKHFMIKVRFSLFGAWLGAIVIPLDWNRPWQNWPIPCSLGAIIGYVLANWMSSFLQYKRRSGLVKKTGKYIL